MPEVDSVGEAFVLFEVDHAGVQGGVVDVKPVVHGGQGQGVWVSQMLPDSPHSAPKVQLVGGTPEHPSVPDGQGIVVTENRNIKMRLCWTLGFFWGSLQSIEPWRRSVANSTALGRV